MKKISYLLLTLFPYLLLAQSPTVEWTKCLGGSSPENAMAVRTTPDGGCIILGNTSSNNGDISDPPGYIDLWVVKLDAQGNISWEKTFGSNNTDYPGSIALSNDGGYVITGTVGSCNRDVVCTNPDDSLWIIKLNSSGILQWQKTYGNNYGDYIQNTADGGYVIAGKTNVNSGDCDAVVLKIDSNGNQQWLKIFGGDHQQEVLSIMQTNEGEYLVAFKDTQISSFDTTILKLATNGDLIWQKNIGSILGDRIYDMQIAADGNYILVGDIYNIDDGFHGGLDAFLIKTTPDGEMLWQKSYGGTSTDLIKSVVALPDGGFAASGFTQSNNSGDVSGPHPNYDAWFFRVDAAGNLLWQKYVGAMGTDVFKDVKQTTDDGFLALGFTSSATIEGGAVNHGSDDILVTKFSAEMLGNDTFEIPVATVFPNPAATVLNFFHIDSTNVKAIKIYNSLGKLIKSQNGHNMSAVDVSDLPTGAYNLLLDKGNTSEVIKFLKK